MHAAQTPAIGGLSGIGIGELFDRREAPLDAFLKQAGTIAAACRDLAEHFAAGGTLLVFGNGGPSTDAQHVAVEFVHPVIVGKRALPALSLTADVATVTGLANAAGLREIFAHQVRVLGRPGDMALGISANGECPNVAEGLIEARRRGMTTVALVGGGGGRIVRDGLADHVVTVASGDPQVVKEAHVTAYHLLWELVHVFLERTAAAAPGRSRTGSGADQ